MPLGDMHFAAVPRSMGARARTWHDPIRDMISTMALNAGVPAKTEVNLSKVSGAASVQDRLLRMDNVLGKSIVTDVCTTVCDTSLSSTIPGHAVAMKEKFKFDYYAPYLTADITLIPVCVDEHGRFGLQADSLFQFLARCRGGSGGDACRSSIEMVGPLIKVTPVSAPRIAATPR